MKTRPLYAYIALIALGLRSVPSIPLAAQAVAAPVECRAPVTTQIYDARGYVYSGVVQPCHLKFIEWTTGVNAPTGGEQLFYIPARDPRVMIGAVVRGIPNVSYNVHAAVPNLLDGGTVRWARAPDASWKDEPTLLPFVPSQIYSLGTDDQGTFYGYGGIFPLAGFSDMAKPLDQDSVIYGVGGHSFSSEDGLQAMLSELSSPGYTEILYVQKNDPNLTIHRAFIPLIKRDAASGTAWLNAVRAHPMFERSSSNQRLLQSAIAFTAFSIMMTALVKLEASPSGQTYQENYRRCMESAATYHFSC